VQANANSHQKEKKSTGELRQSDSKISNDQNESQDFPSYDRDFMYGGKKKGGS